MSAWTTEELKLALALYCQTPFGRMHSRNSEIIRLAEKLGRTPSAVAMKLVNFASLDPQIANSGRKGLGNASSLDRQVWNDFQQNWEQEIVPASQELSMIEQQVPSAPSDSETTRLASVEIRTHQSIFRRIILGSYVERCCITGLSEPRLLVASHIVPWSMSREHRVNPRNGLCLSSLHDNAFDCGLITVLPDFTVCVSSQLKQKHNESFARHALVELHGASIRLPEKFWPDAELLRWHNDHVFLG